uniref:Uncharacterized protein n=1 Tax=Anguilla anguilla TaxID=7936 RepID=A0A0E9TZ37_ANGAN
MLRGRLKQRGQHPVILKRANPLAIVTHRERHSKSAAT